MIPYKHVSKNQSVSPKSSGFWQFEDFSKPKNHKRSVLKARNILLETDLIKQFLLPSIVKPSFQNDMGHIQISKNNCCKSTLQISICTPCYFCTASQREVTIDIRKIIVLRSLISCCFNSFKGCILCI